MAGVALPWLAGILAASAGEPATPAPVAGDRVLVGRIVASRDVVVVQGDMALQWFSYAVEPRDAPGTRLIVVTDSTLCPVPGVLGRTYEMHIHENRIAFGIHDEEDRQWMSSLMIFSCAQIEQ